MSDQYQVVSDVLFSDIDGEVIILSPEEDAYLSLDATGSRIWLLLQNAMSLDDLVNLLTEEYEVSAEDCLHDVQSFLEDMIQRQLIKVQEK